MSNFSEPGSTIVPPPAPPEPKTALWEDFIDIFYAPSEVYRRRATSGFFVPMLVVTVLSGCIALANSGVMQPMMDAEFERNMRASGGAGMTPEAMAGARKFTEVVGKIGGFILPPLGILATGLFLWLIGKLVDAKQSLGAAFMVTAYAYTIRVVEYVLGGVQGLLMDPASLNSRFKISFGVARFLHPDETSPILLAVVGRMDLFTIWLTVLLAIGLSVTGKIPRTQAYLAGAMLWVAGALPNVLTALRS